MTVLRSHKCYSLVTLCLMVKVSSILYQDPHRFYCKGSRCTHQWSKTVKILDIDRMACFQEQLCTLRTILKLYTSSFFTVPSTFDPPRCIMKRRSSFTVNRSQVNPNLDQILCHTDITQIACFRQWCS